jgi:hypothetical protein
MRALNPVSSHFLAAAFAFPASAHLDPPDHLAPTAAAEARRAIEAQLHDMSHAVLAGNKVAYLALVDPDNPWFRTEHQHWADDLDRHKPAEFNLEIVDDPATPDDDPVFEADCAKLHLRMRYRSTIGHAAVEQGKQATWPAVFLLRDADGDGPAPAAWLYAGEDWLSLEGRTLDGQPFIVRYFAGDQRDARLVLEAFPQSKAHVDDGFEIDYRPVAPIEIKLYKDMEHLKAWVYPSMPDESLGGWNEPGESIKFMSYYARSVPGWRAAFAHEYGHVATWEMGPKPKNLPWWVAEGVAELAAEKFNRNRAINDRRIRSLARGRGGGGRLAAWDEISDYDTTAANLKYLAYEQGHHMLGYISERWGRRTRNTWLREMTAGKSLDEATRAALGVSFAELDEAWRASLLDSPADEHR